MANQDLIECIARELSEGKTEEVVRENMKGNGWTPEDINGAFAIVKIKGSPLGMGGHVTEPTDPAPKSSSFFSILLILIILATIGAIAYNYFVRVGKIAPLSYTTVDSLLIFVKGIFK